MVRAGSWRRVWVVAVLPVLLLTACDWASFGFDAGNTRSNPGETAISKDNVGGLVESWRTKVLTGAGAISGTPAVAKGRLFVQAGGSSGSGRLAAYDATGAASAICRTVTTKVCSPLWESYDLPSTTSGDPTVVDGKVYVVAQGLLQVYDAAGGLTTCSDTTPRICTPLWTTWFQGVPDLDRPVVANGLVFVTVGGEVRAYNTSTLVGCSGTTPVVCPTVRVYRATDGTLGSTRPVVVDGILYAGGNSGGNNGSLYAFDATGGTGCDNGNPTNVCNQLWSAPGGNYRDSSPLVSGGRVYTHPDGEELKVFDAKGCGAATCTPLWRTSGVSNGYASPALANGRLYVANQAGTLGVFDANGVENSAAKVCSPLWKASVPKTSSLHRSSPAVANGLVFLGSNADRLYTFDANGSKGCNGATKVCGFLWRSPTTGGGIFSSPIVANGIVFVGSDTGRVHTYKP